MSARTARCVCGHLETWHDGGHDCDACACDRYLDRHLPGQVMLGEGAS